MIKYLTNKEIDKQKWDDCIKQSFNGLIYANSWYLDIVAGEWEALVQDDYETVFPLVNSYKWGIHYLFQPVFTQQLGIFSTKILSETVVEEFLENFPAKYKFVEINFNTFNKVPPGKYKTSDWINHELDLINSFEKLYKNYSTNLKRNLKKAEKSGITLSKNIKPDEVIRIFTENRGKQIKTLKEDDYSRLRRLAYKGIYKGLINTYGIYTDKNELCAGAIFARSYKKIIFLFSGLSEDGRDLNAMPFLINSFIKEHAQQHITLDFEGSNDPNLARFYKSFGSTTCTYPHIRMNRLPFLIKQSVDLVKMIKR